MWPFNSLEKRTRQWHAQIQRNTWGGFPSPGFIQMEFCLSYPCPFVHEILPLQKHTDDLLTKYGELSETTQDAKLNDLIRGAEHELSAFLACCHRLSAPEIQLWIFTISKRVQSSSQAHTYINIILAISGLNAAFLRESEIKHAKNLKAIVEFNDKYPEMIYQLQNTPSGVTVMMNTISAFQAAKEVMNEPLSTRKGNIWPEALKGFLKEFYNCLKDIMTRLQPPDLWELAFTYVKPMVLDYKWILLVQFCEPNDLRYLGSSHYAWKNWNPSSVYLAIIARLPATYREMPTFRNFFVLVGPDFETGRYQSFVERHIREAAIPNFICMGNIGVLAKPTPGIALRNVVDMLFQVIDKASQAVPPGTSNQYLELIECILSAGIVNENHIKILDMIIGNNAISTEMMQTYRLFLTNGLASSTDSEYKIRTLRKLLQNSQLPTFVLIKHSLGNLIGDVITRDLNARIATLRSNLWSQSSLLADHFTESLECIELFKSDRWLGNFIESSTRSTALAIPSLTKISAILAFELQARTRIQDIAQLHKTVTAYCEVMLFGSSPHELDENGFDLASALFKVTTESDQNMIVVAYTVAEWTHISTEDRVFIISTIQKTKKSSSFAKKLEKATRSDLACVKLARMLSDGEVEKISAWTRMLEIMIAPVSETIYETTALRLDLPSWINWLDDIRTLFTPNNTTILATGLRHKWLQAWTKRLSTRRFYFPKLAAILGNTGPGMKKIYTNFERPDSMMRLLDQIAKCNKKHYTACRFLFHRIPLNKTEDMKEFHRILRFWVRSSETNNPALQKLLSIFEYSDEDLMHGMLLIWSRSSLNDESLNKWPEKDTFTYLLKYLDLSGTDLRVCVNRASEYITGRFDAFQSRVSELRSLRANLKFHDSERTKAFLGSLGMKDQGGLLYIPEHLFDFIDEVKPWIFDLYFYFDSLKPIQRLTLGVGGARNLVVRIEIPNGIARPTFKIRLGYETDNKNGLSYQAEDEEEDESTFLKVSAFMTTKKQEKAHYAVARNLWHHFAAGFDDIEEVYNVVSEALVNMDRCAVCLAALHVRVFRFTTCQNSACIENEVWGRMQLLEICPKVLDLFLLSTMSVTIIGDNKLLPFCPTSISDPLLLNFLMSSVPDTSSLQSVMTSTTPILEIMQVYTLLKYLASFRVFITEATGMLRLPSLPGVQQFVIWNSTPEVEGLRAKWFDTRRQEGSSQVVFHGTSFDRLFLILSEGLKALSGTQWQTNGATYGKGIYCSPDISLALWYAVNGRKWRNSMFGNDYRLVLGCELVGKAREVSADRRIMVVDDATQLSARYLLLFPPNVSAPESRFVEPAMKSAFGLIRAGTL